MSNQVEGMGGFCDSICPICVAARDKAKWLRPLVKLAYYCFCGKPAMFLRIPSPCTSREKQTGRKPWE
ncbi:MAG TPA: hypothetical protein VMV84_01940 [Dehalococcoidales bacterium]|nr:hypothetical protein [Dehalococcoidales bacterium]